MGEAGESAIRAGRTRATLLAGTSLAPLLVLAWTGQAAAQPAANARPTAGQVSAGTASISQTVGTTTITQASHRAAVNWQGFDVGSEQQVTFRQPSASAITLNRVVGPGASQIAGKIDANGQIALVNPAGVVLYRGAQVNAAAVLVSAAGISDRNFMAGRMVFDQPAPPNARIENRGTITVKQAGLAAFVAPEVVNSGVINAKLGHVVLAGAKSATLDLYGDGLLSIDVSGQVAQVPVGSDGREATALVTNTGTILADGGKVQLTARAVDGVVQTLVRAGGKISAGTIGDRRGIITLNGVGGSVVVTGDVTATGAGQGTTGGRIEVLADHDVRLVSGATVDVSGRAGGGTVALGTTLARASHLNMAAAPTSRSTTVQKGATVHADATDAGKGGRIVVVSSGVSALGGTATARGGPNGGNGGFLELSGSQVGLTGQVNIGAPFGQPGSLLLDPMDLYISDTQPAGTTGISPSGGKISADDQPGAISSVSLTALENAEAAVTLEATRDIFFARSAPGEGVTNLLQLPAEPLVVTAGRDLSVDRGFTINALSLSFIAGRNIDLAANAGAAVGIATGIAAAPATLNAGGMLLSAGGGISFGDAAVTVAPPPPPPPAAPAILGAALAAAAPLVPTPDALDVRTGAGGLTQAASGVLVTPDLWSGSVVGGTANLTGTANKIASIAKTGNLSVSGDLTLTNAGDLTVSGAVSAANITLRVITPNGTLTIPAGTTGEISTPPGVLTATAAPGRISLAADNISVGASTAAALAPKISAPGGTVELAPNTAGRSVVFGPTPAPLPAPAATGLVIDPPLLAAIAPATGTLRVGRITGDPGPVAGDISLEQAVTLSATASTLELDATGAITQTLGSTLTVGTLAGQGGSFLLDQPNTINTIDIIGALATTGSFDLTDGPDLTVTGPLSFNSGTLTTGGNLTIAGPVTGTALRTSVSGNILRTGGAFSIGTLTGAAGGNADFGNGAAVNALGAFSTTGRFTLGTTGDLGVAGPLSLGTGALSAGGNLVITGPVTASQLDLKAAGGIAADSALVVGTLTGSAGGDAAFTASNAISALGAFSTGGRFTLGTAGGLTVTGPLSLGTGAFSAGGNLVITGPVTASQLDLKAAGGIAADSALVVGTLTGSAGGDAAFTASNTVSALGPFTAPSGVLTLMDDPPLTIVGPLTAQQVQISATGQLILAANVAGLGNSVSTLAVQPSPSGAPSFVQTGTVALTGTAGSAPVVQIVLPGGSMTFAGLDAAQTGLVLSAGSATLSGTLVAGTLLVLGQGGAARLDGSVAGDVTGGAARRAAIEPAINPAYTFNGCIIGAALCDVPAAVLAETSVQGGLILYRLLPSGLPASPTLLRLALQPVSSLTPPPGRLTDPDVLPPNISERDY
jgi:filamentous hemagglutinin family protein